MPKTYTTISGDMWDGVALKTLGSEMRADKLIESNLRHKDYFIFPAGIQLVIPEIKLKMASSLPPWKRSQV
jgi:hypothetical protein